MKSHFRIPRLSVILLFLLTLFVLVLPVSAETTRAVSYVLSGYSGTESGVFTPANGSGVRVLDMSGAWGFLGDVMYVRQQIRGESCAAYAILDTDESTGELTFVLELANDLSNYNAICFGVGVTSQGTFFPEIDVDMELSDFAGNRVTSQTALHLAAKEDAEDRNIQWNMVYFDISGFEKRSNSSELTVTFTYDPDSPPDVLRITNPYATAKDGGGFSHIDRYLTNSFEESAGAFGMKSGAARPDERGQVHLSGEIILAEQPAIGSDIFLELEVSHFITGGLTVGIGYDSGEIAYSSRIYLNSDGDGSEFYTVPVHMTDRLRSIELVFDGMVCEGYFKIEGVRLYSDDTVGISGTPALGKVTGIGRDGDFIRFSGVMEREAVRENDGTVIRFFALPAWSADRMENAVEIGQTKISTRFDYTADLSAFPHLADVCLFFAGLRTGDGEIVPLSAPVYPKAAEIAEKTLSNFGLYDAAVVGVFESNVSHSIIDVPLDRLLTAAPSDGETVLPLSYTVYDTVSGEDASGRMSFAGRTEIAALNLALLRTLDSEINFCISAGIEVYLRLTAETPVPGLTRTDGGAEHYAVRTDTPDARFFYAAVVRFLCSRYSGIAGLVTGHAVNDGRHTGDTGTVDAAVYARETAELCRITYNAASTEIPDILIVLPFGEERTEEETETFRFFDPKTLAVMLSHCLEEGGTVPWVMMYCADNLTGILGTEVLYGDDLSADARFSDSRGAAQRIRQLLDELGMKGSAATMYYYEPSYESVLLGFRKTSGQTVFTQYLAEMFVKVCGSTRARAVFLSLEHLNERLDHDFYSYLKKTENSMNSSGSSAGTGAHRRSVSDYLAVPSESAADTLSRMTVRKAVWDFTDQFYPLGWIAGGGVGSCLTVYSDLFSEDNAPGERYSRVLRSEITLDEDSASEDRKGIAAGIVLRNLARTVDMSGVDCLEFSFALNHPGVIMGTGHEAGTVVFIIGSDDCRAEFTVQDANYGHIQNYLCDLSDYEFRGQVDYMGILVYGDHEMYLDLSSVTAYSSTLSQTELDDVFALVPGGGAEEPDYAAIVLVSGIVFIGSVTAVVLLIRHDAEEIRERRRQQLRDEKYTKRERLRTRRD